MKYFIIVPIAISLSTQCVFMRNFFPTEPEIARNNGKTGYVLIAPVRLKDSTGGSFVAEVFRENLRFELAKQGFVSAALDETSRESLPYKDGGRITFPEEPSDVKQANSTAPTLKEESPKFIGISENELKNLSDKTKFDYFIESTVILKETGTVLDPLYSVFVFIRVSSKSGKKYGEIRFSADTTKEKLDDTVKYSTFGSVKQIKDLVKND
ncbi:lipoprotein [Leptospira koniambonensis]|uniref:lipoprotein n=1 Tax=Leptospira koniambonensis TaxID=2484950 RepID=UPI003EB9B36C